MSMDGYSDLGIAKLDTGREERTGFPEVIFCQGKADEHLLAIVRDIYARQGRVFGTRASVSQYEFIKKSIPGIGYDRISRVLKIAGEEATEGIGEIAVCTAGTADIPVAEEAAQTVEFFGGHVER